MQGIYNVRDYVTGTDDQGYDRDSQGFEAAVGLTGKRGDLSGEITVGVLSQNYDDARFKTVTVPTVGADLTWRSGPGCRRSEARRRSGIGRYLQEHYRNG